MKRRKKTIGIGEFARNNCTVPKVLELLDLDRYNKTWKVEVNNELVSVQDPYDIHPMVLRDIRKKSGGIL